MAEISLFVGHGMGDALYPKGVKAFRSKVRLSIRRAEQGCKAKGIEVSLKPFFVSGGYGQQLPGLVREALQSSGIALFDLTGLRPNVLYEMGYFTGLGRPSIVIMRRGTELPADLGDVLAGVYDDERELPNLVSERLAAAVQELRGPGASRVRGLNDVWFPRAPAVVAVVCAPEPERSRFASRDEANYLFIDTLEDRDALFEVATYLSRAFPECRVERHSSDAIGREAKCGHLVLIGGPGESGGAGNAVCRDVLGMVKASVRYSDACDKAFFKDKEYTPKFDSRGQLVSDYGYFLRAPNPFHPDHTVIVVSGVYTSGTLGAALALSDHPQARRNAEVVRAALGVRTGGNDGFEAFFPVEVHSGGAVACPKLSARHVLKL